MRFQGCGAGGNANCDDEDDQGSVENPLFEAQGSLGQNPLFEPDSIAFIPIQFADGRDVEMIIAFAESVPGGLPAPPGGGYPFDLTLRDLATNQRITQFDPPIDIILGLPRYASRNPSTGFHPNLALRYYDVETDAWLLVDKGLDSCGNGQYCGKTNHFTFFSIGAIPEPSSLALGLAAIGFVAMKVRRRPR